MKKDPLKSRATIHRLTALADAGLLSHEAWERACVIAGHTPSVRDWRIFINRALLVVGIIFIIAGILFLGAYNDVEPPRWAQFAGLQAAIVVCVGAAHFFSVDGLVGKLALLVASMLVGGLLAVIGQEYQTGANAFEVFLVWAVLITGFVVVSRWAPLLLVWWVLMNLGLATFGMQMLDWTVAETLIALILMNIGGLVAWEYGYLREIDWLEARWIPRLMIFITLSMEVYLMLIFMFSRDDYPIRYAALPLFILLLPGLLVFYTQLQRDLFVLAICGLSGIVLSVATVVRLTMELRLNRGGECVIGLIFLFTAGMVLLETIGIVQGLSQLHTQWEGEE